MTTFVLVHGAYHGAWCWYRLRAELQARGHTVVTPELPAHGTDTTPVADVSLEAYVDRICETLDDADEPVLVGHSMSGICITQAAERRPEDIGALVYLTAYLPADEETMLDQRSDASILPENFEIDEERGVGWVRESVLDEAFYGDCSIEDRALARSLLRPEPMAPLSTPVAFTESRFGDVPKAYLRCSKDRAITLQQQDAMLDRLACNVITTSQASHSPFLSVPIETASALEATVELT